MKKRKMLTFLPTLALCFLFVAQAPGLKADAEARRFGGGFRSSGFSRPFRGGATRSRGLFSSYGGRRKSRPVGGGFFGGTGRRGRGADSLQAKKTARRGKMFSTQSSAASNYRKNMKTKWSSKPKTRPEYIPKSINRNGTTRNVIYNNGSYGFRNMAGTFIALTAADMLITNAMLSRRGYMWGGQGGYGGGYGHYPPASNFSFLSGLMFFGFIIYVAGRIRQGRGLF